MCKEKWPVVRFTMALLISPSQTAYGPVSSWLEIVYGPVEITTQKSVSPVLDISMLSIIQGVFFID